MTAETYHDLLRSIPLFAGADPADLEALAAVATEADFPAGRSVVRQGDPGSGLFVVLEGTVRVVRDGELLAELGPGRWFGELAVLDRGPRTAAVVTAVPTRCLAVAAWDAERLMLERPTLAVAVARAMAERLRGVLEDHHG
jgi:CRP-like cAMP-binding protein